LQKAEPKDNAKKNPLKEIGEIVNCMGSLKEVDRLMNGLSLIDKEELVKQSQALEGAKNGDLQNLIKKAIASATDLSGLTKGKARRISNPGSSNPDSIVHFKTTTNNNSFEEATHVTFCDNPFFLYIYKTESSQWYDDQS
jgi:hypothetical protein